MSLSEIKSEIESLPMEERRQIAAYVVALRHKDLAEYRTAMAAKIDDGNPENWISLVEYDQWLAS